MKIRCRNCYRVLNPNEEYCTHCGEHSDEMAQYMAEGKHELDAMAKFKLSLVIYICIAFLGTGILMISFALIQNRLAETYDTNTCKALSFVITSVVLLLTLIIINFKELKSMFFNGTKKQLLLAIIIGIISIAILVLVHNLSGYTRVIPNYISDYVDGKIVITTDILGVSSPFVVISLILSIISQEIVFRRRFIDALDEDTLLGDRSIILLGALVGTALDFIWIMSPETLLMTFVLNGLMSAIYIYTNRSIGINLILRIILICLILII